MSKIKFRTGTHNPYTLYVVSEPIANSYGGRNLPGWMREFTDGRSEWFISSLPNESLVMVAVEALNAFVCERCPWGCESCSLNRSDCGCYEHEAPEESDDPMPVFVLKAKDRLAVDTIEQYARYCYEEGLHHQRDQVSRALAEIVAWRSRHRDRVKLPDHDHVPATSGPSSHAPGVAALVAAINVTALVDGRCDTERPVLDIATELIAALAGQGWRLIHD